MTKRKRGQGTVAAHRGGWLARLPPSGGRRSLGTFPTEAEARQALDDARDGKRSVIYFVQAVGGGPIKIGRTSQLDRRLAAFATANHAPMVLLATEPGAWEREQVLHRKFRADRLKGEWFSPSTSLLAYIGELVTKTRHRPTVSPRALVALLRDLADQLERSL
jgi:hypothetical protein